MSFQRRSTLVKKGFSYSLPSVAPRAMGVFRGWAAAPPIAQVFALFKLPNMEKDTSALQRNSTKSVRLRSST